MKTTSLIRAKTKFTGISGRLMKQLTCLMAGSLFTSVSVAASYTLLTEELPPASYKVGNKITGASVDIVEEMFKRAGISYEVKLLPLQRAIVDVKEKPNHCVFPLERSQEVEVAYNWISPVLITRTAFYTKDDSKVNLRTLNDAKGMKIGSYRGSDVADYLEGQGFTVELLPKDAANLQKLQAGRIDVWAADRLLAGYLMKEAKATDIKEQLVFFTKLRGLACNLGMEQSDADKLQDALKSMYSDGTTEKIRAKY